MNRQAIMTRLMKRASAGVSALPPPRDVAKLRERMETAIERLIIALDAMDAPREDLEEGGDVLEIDEDFEDGAKGCADDPLFPVSEYRPSNADRKAARSAKRFLAKPVENCRPRITVESAGGFGRAPIRRKQDRLQKGQVP